MSKLGKPATYHRLGVNHPCRVLGTSTNGKTCFIELTQSRQQLSVPSEAVHYTQEAKKETAVHVEPTYPWPTEEVEGLYGHKNRHDPKVVSGASIKRHSGKMSLGVAKYCLQKGQELGLWQPGKTWIIDPFGGIGTTAIVAGANGYQTISIELEQDYFELMTANVERNKAHHLKPITAVTLHGDCIELLKRNALDIWANSQQKGVLSSPPFSTPNNQPKTGNVMRADLAEGEAPQETNQATTGNLAAMPHRDASHAQAIAQAKTSKGILSSPPYADVIKHGEGPGARGTSGGHIITTNQATTNPAYGQTEGQIGEMSENDYWLTMGKFCTHLYHTLETNEGGVFVVKDYVRAGKRIELCRQMAELFEAAGFTIIKVVKAMLVETEERQTLDGRFVKVVTKEHKTQFRKRIETLGGPPINYELLIFFKKENQV